MITVKPSRRTIQPTRRLRALLTWNGVLNVVGGALILPLVGVLHAPIGLSPALLATIGVFYVGYGSAMWFAATRPRPLAVAVGALIAVNPVWALDCLLIAGAGLAHPTTLGTVVLVAEAATVTTLAALQLLGYRRSTILDADTLETSMAEQSTGAGSR